MRLGVNIDHIATLRQIRLSDGPDILEAARICQKSGADSIVVHLREDRRHIQDKDVRLLRKNLKIILNLEMSINTSIVDIASRILPDRSTLVPEKRQELTTEGGLDVFKLKKDVARAVSKLLSRGIDVSLFIDPSKKQILAAREVGCSLIELHTGRYANAKRVSLRKKYIRELKEAAVFAKKNGFSVFAGHGLDYDNVSSITDIEEIEELNIGYSIICRSVFTGLEKAVREMKHLLI